MSGDPRTDPPARDPGLQAERTALAWQRTGVSGAMLAGTTIVAAAHLSGPAVLAVVAVLGGLCAVAVAVTVTATRPSRGKDSPWRRLLAVAALPVLLGVAGTVLAFTPA